MKSATRTSKAIRLAVLVSGMAGLAVGLMAWQQVKLEYRSSLDDLSRRSRVIASRLNPVTEEVLKLPDPEAAIALGPKLEGDRRLLGLAVYRANGQLLASGKALEEHRGALTAPVARAFQGGGEAVETARSEGLSLHILVLPIRDAQGAVTGALVVLHDASYLDDRMTEGLVRGAFWILVITLLLATTIAGMTWMMYERPLRKLADWMRRLRVEHGVEEPPPALPDAALATETDRLAASLRAARSSSWAASSETARADKAWTRERLRAHAVECLHGDQLIVVSNREPYMHQFQDRTPRAIVPASGVVTAMDPVLQACGGVWIAHGAGDADRGELLPQQGGRAVDVVGRRDDEDRRVRGPKPRPELAHEVREAGRVDEVDGQAVALERRDGEADRPVALALLWTAAGDAGGHEMVEQRGFPGSARTHEDDVADVLGGPGLGRGG